MTGSEMIALCSDALKRGWSDEGLRGTLEGAARDESGNVIACCVRCGRPEHEDGAHLIETDEPDVYDLICTPCKMNA
jgi:hypothetical protein